MRAVARSPLEEDMATLAISVIVPVHNGAQVLGDCLRAVFASSYATFECIVVDDGSTDDSRLIASQFPVTIVPLENGPHGPAYARNRGVMQARGDVVFFVDADVAIRPDTLPKIALTLTQHPDVDAVFGSYDDSPAA